MANLMQRVTSFTDGACRKNSGPGGWAAVLIYRGQEKGLSGSVANTTNNRMELRAAIEALNALRRRCNVELFTESEYLKKGISHWLPLWKKRGFRTIDGQPVKNQDLWQKLEEVASQHDVEWKWVRGHVGNRFNELCDRLAKEALDKGVKSRKFGSRCIAHPNGEAHNSLDRWLVTGRRSRDLSGCVGKRSISSDHRSHNAWA